MHTAEGRKTLYGKTRQEITARLAKALSDRDGEMVFDAGNQTVGEYLKCWLNRFS